MRRDRYDDLVDKIRAAFQKAYIKKDGTVGTGTQTSYVVALYTKMAPEKLESKLMDKLVKDIESRNWHLSTGFLGTPFLLFVLADHGRAPGTCGRPQDPSGRSGNRGRDP